MNRYFIRYPGFRTKALTLSYDDGRRPGRPPDRNHDKAWGQGDLQPQRPLLHSASQAPGPPPPHSGGGPRPLSRRRAEVAVHSYSHPFLEQLPRGNAAWEIVRDREILEGMFGCIVRGMAYPMGTSSGDVAATLRQCGIAYARTTQASHGFGLPEDWLRFSPTCRHQDPSLPPSARSSSPWTCAGA